MGRRLALERAPPASVSPDLTAPGGGGPGASRGAALPLPTSPSPLAATSLQTRAEHRRAWGLTQRPADGGGPGGPGATPRPLGGTCEREAGPPVPPGFVRSAVDLPTVSAERKTAASGERRGPRLGGECGGRLRRCVAPAVPQRCTRFAVVLVPQKAVQVALL